MANYTSLVTLDGQAKIAAAVSGGPTINVTHLCIGDGNGAPVIPVETATSLVNEVWRGGVTSAARDPSNPTQVIVTAVIPVEVGPLTVREVGLLTDDGKLFAVANYPETYKPAGGEGAVSDITVEFVVVVDTTAQITVTVNALTQINVGQFLRVPFMVVDGYGVNTPPANPNPGDIYIVGTAPESAWVGQANKLAQWNSSIWVISDIPAGHLVINRAVAEDHASRWLRRTATGWASADASTTSKGVIELATYDEARGLVDGVKAITPATLKAAVAQILGDVPFFPHVIASNGILSVNSSTGQVVLNANQEWLHRGIRYSTSAWASEQRTFATAPSKTYHLRLNPNDGPRLIDVTSLAYNPSNLPETNPAFDSSYDDMLVCKVVTSAANVPAVTPLVNKISEIDTAEKSGITAYSGANNASFTTTFTYNFARTPKVTFGSVGGAQMGGAGSDLDLAISNVTTTRYGTTATAGFDFATIIVMRITYQMKATL